MGSARLVLVLRLEALEGPGDPSPLPGDRVMEFHVSAKARRELGFEASLFSSTGNIVVPDFHEARLLARKINEKVGAALVPERAVRAGKLNAMALIDEILHDVARLYRERVRADAFDEAVKGLEAGLGKEDFEILLHAFVEGFPPLAVHRGEMDAAEWLAASAEAPAGARAGATGAPGNRELAIEELLLLRLANENPAFGPFRFLFDDGSPGSDDARRRPSGLAGLPSWTKALGILEAHFAALPAFGPDSEDLVSMLRAPMRAAPYSLPGQLDYIRRKWGLLVGGKLLRLLGGLDLMREEEKPFFPGPGPTRALVYSGMEKEYERFSPDRDWMPNVVMMAKSSLVWLDQLSKSYGREVRRLDQIPDEELDSLASRGFNSLWLIGLWERSAASERIKRKCGNPEAAASAYSLFDYEIAEELGGWPALERLRHRAWQRGLRLAADMVPNHTGIDSAWMRERPDLFMRSDSCPFPGYTFDGEDLSGDGSVGIWLEDHYYDRTDAAVVLKRLDRRTGRVDYVYHGNDGTGLPWSDTAQLDFLNPATREAVKERILHVARNFPIIRFDAAMVLSKKHFRRLWYPEPGQGGDIPSRAERALSHADFEGAMPAEFWREVVDTCAGEAPDTLLLAEAFWMMEGYFVRTLGMHRVYNSAFMNMLKREENAKYRETIRNTQEFDKDILKRFVNFMNNPDEDTAIAQFGSGDKYFGICTMMATMPGLPMFGHGQIEGLSEKYGMEYRKAYRDEGPDPAFLSRHEREIFPLLKRRHLFSGVDEFLLFDLAGTEGSVNDNVFVYANGAGTERALVAYNNSYSRAEGWIRESAPYAEKRADGGRRMKRRSLAEALGLHAGDGRFLVMREQRAGHWFLRRSRDVVESGLHLMLEGFQSQVFLDIFEVTDDARGLYAALHDGLGGAGVPDLSEALEDLARKGLYSILASLVSPAFFTSLRSFASAATPAAAAAPGDAARRGGSVPPPPSPPEPAGIPAEGKAAARKPAKAGLAALGGPTLPAFLAATRVRALELYSAIRGLVREEAAEEGLDGVDAPRGSPAAKKSDAAASEAAAGRLVAGLARLALASTGTMPMDPALTAWLARNGGLESAAAFLVLDALSELAVSGPRFREARSLAERLGLERKLREALRAAAVAGDHAWRGTALAKVLAGCGLAGPASASAKGGPSPGLGPLFVDIDRDEELRGLIGVNVWEGTVWFNREAFGDYLDFSTLSALIRGRGPAKIPGPETPGWIPSIQVELAEAATRLVAELRAVRAAERGSGYRLADFEAALALSLNAAEGQDSRGARTAKTKARPPAPEDAPGN